MLVVNLFAGPGAGKSTTASGVFNLLKKNGVNCELIHEEAKEFTWEERHMTLLCQPYIYTKQMRNLWRLKNKVDIAITDSPLLLSLVYGNSLDWPKSFFQYAIDQFNEFDNLNFFIRRQKLYNPIGRNQTEEEAKILDDQILKILVDKSVSCVILDADELIEAKIAELARQKIKKS